MDELTPVPIEYELDEYTTIRRLHWSYVRTFPNASHWYLRREISENDGYLLGVSRDYMSGLIDDGISHLSWSGHQWAVKVSKWFRTPHDACVEWREKAKEWKPCN